MWAWMTTTRIHAQRSCRVRPAKSVVKAIASLVTLHVISQVRRRSLAVLHSCTLGPEIVSSSGSLQNESNTVKSFSPVQVVRSFFPTSSSDVFVPLETKLPSESQETCGRFFSTAGVHHNCWTPVRPRCRFTQLCFGLVAFFSVKVSL